MSYRGDFCNACLAQLMTHLSLMLGSVIGDSSSIATKYGLAILSPDSKPAALPQSKVAVVKQRIRTSDEHKNGQNFGPLDEHCFSSLQGTVVLKRRNARTRLQVCIFGFTTATMLCGRAAGLVPELRSLCLVAILL